jgi:geranylgeranylglycerol-phosphate geranylgeranyltransferase
MNLVFMFKVAFGLIGILNANAFVKFKNGNPFERQRSLVKYNPLPPTDPLEPFKNKINGLVRLIRPKSILPTLFLNLSGGWIMNPSFNNLIHSTSFIVSTANTILILMSSMVINDIYDYKIDKVNNPSRPIASGQIKIYEAVLLNIFLVGTAEILSMRFLCESLQLIIHFAIINVFLYTPVFKRIPFIKNISCASLVAFTIFFSGLSSTTSVITQHKNFGFLAITLSLVFYGSLSNEILLDIRDYEGDKKNGVVTIPVLFGKNIAWLCAKIVANLNIMSNVLSLFYLTDFNTGAFLAVICSPITFNLYKLKNEGYTKKNIEKVVNDTNVPLFFTLLYFCILAAQGGGGTVLK